MFIENPFFAPVSFVSYFCFLQTHHKTLKFKISKEQRKLHSHIIVFFNSTCDKTITTLPISTCILLLLLYYQYTDIYIYKGY